MDFPNLAFNGGAFNRATIDEAVVNGQAELVADAQDVVIRHLWIEAFENDFRTSTHARTVFEICESTFADEIPPPRELNQLVVRYVVLDYTGKPLGQPTKVVYRRDGGKWS